MVDSVGCLAYAGDMRIAILSSGLGHTARGIETWAATLAESLHGEGEAVILLHGGGRYACPNVRLRFRHRDTPVIRLVNRLAPRWAWRWGWTSRYALEQHGFARAFLRWWRAQDPADRPAIIHTQDYVVGRRLHVAGLGAPVIFGNLSDEPPASLAGLPFLQHASEPDYAAALAEPGLRGARHFLVPSFVDARRFAPGAPDRRGQCRRRYGIPEDACVIGCVAALQRRHKRLDALIDEVASLSRTHPSVHLLLAGARTDDTAAVEQAARLALGDRVTVRRDEPFDAMPAIYGAMDLYVHPAPDEVFGLCLLEAMACAVPVLAHDSPRLRYVVGEGGRLTDVTRPGFLGREWPALVAARDALGRRGRRRVEQTFAWPAVYPLVMAMYQAITGQPDGRGAGNLRHGEGEGL